MDEPMAPKQVILVTGASRGIGLAVVTILLKQGYNVVAMSRSTPPELEQLASTYPGVLVIFKGDASKDGDNQAAVEGAMQAFGRLDSLILNAGTLYPLGKVASLKGRVDEVKELFDINYFALVSILTHAIPYLRTKEDKGDLGGAPAGRVIFVSSGASVGNTGGWSAYNASKAAMNSLSRTLASEEPEVASVAVRPGVVATTMQDAIRALGSDHMSEKDYAKFVDMHTDGKLLKPEQPGAVIAGLSVSAPREMSGTYFSWDEAQGQKYAI